MARRLTEAAAPLCAAFVLAAALAACDSGGGSQDPPRPSLFQVSTLGALSRGVFDGALTIGDLAAQGTFGLGTFDRVDGEMIVLDGVVYQVRTDGLPHVADPGDTTPFAAVTDFAADEEIALAGARDYADLQSQLDGYLSTFNVPVAIRIRGLIPRLEVRSVPAQDPPYPTLSEVVAEQTVFEISDVEGTMVGFRSPAYLSELNAAGYHFHFLADDRQAGGHVLDGRFSVLTVELQYLRDFAMWLPPPNGPFDSADLDPEMCLP